MERRLHSTDHCIPTAEAGVAGILHDLQLVRLGQCERLRGTGRSPQVLQTVLKVRRVLPPRPSPCTALPRYIVCEWKKVQTHTPQPQQKIDWWYYNSSQPPFFSFVLACMILRASRTARLKASCTLFPSCEHQVRPEVGGTASASGAQSDGRRDGYCERHLGRRLNPWKLVLLRKRLRLARRHLAARLQVLCSSEPVVPAKS